MLLLCFLILLPPTESILSLSKLSLLGLSFSVLYSRIQRTQVNALVGAYFFLSLVKIRGTALKWAAEEAVANNDILSHYAGVLANM